MHYDPEIHHRRSIRLKGYDYTQPGAYFVTLVTAERESIFGVVTSGEMKLSTLGQIALDEWIRSIGIRKEIQLHKDEFVVMPNHIHGIVWIVGAYGIRPSSSIHPDCPEEDASRPSSRGDAPQPPVQSFRRIPKSLGAFIGGYKAAVTSRARRDLNITTIWQRNYYEHIIRNETEFETLWNYIDNNPHQWEQDQLKPGALSNPIVQA